MLRISVMYWNLPVPTEWYSSNDCDDVVAVMYGGVMVSVVEQVETTAGLSHYTDGSFLLQRQRERQR